jgi:hypothetical protein
MAEWSEDKKKYHREYMKRRYYERKNSCSCLRCGGAKEIGIILCEKCKESVKVNNLKYMSKESSKVVRNERMNDQRKANDGFRLAETLRSRMYQRIKKDKAGSSIDDLGCSIPELKQYLESKFEPGMSWSNWSKTGWHIDHIRPLASFDLTDPEQFKQACHYTNLQPMWAKDNLSKGAKYEAKD